MISKLLRWGWRNTFLVLCTLCSLAIVSTFTEYGITIDEPSHVEYGSAVAAWHTSLFSDPTALALGNTYLYGGAFDLFQHLLARVSPLGLYDTRHLINALAGLVGIGVVYRLGAILGTRRTGFLAALLLALTPRYYGHSFNNHKDIPFAILYAAGLYILVEYVRRLPGLTRLNVWKAGLVIGLAMGVRVGGVVLLAYGAFAVFAQEYVDPRENGGWNRWRSPVRHLAAMALVAWSTKLLFWPWAQQSPILRPLEALTTFSRFPQHITTFFEGAEFSLHEILWYYAPKWLLLALPDSLLVGLGAALVALVWAGLVSRSYPALHLGWSLILLGALFPIGFAVLQRTPLYDGLRHLLFVVPPLALLAAWGLDTCLDRAGSLKPLCAAGILCLFGLVLFDAIRLHPNEYVYFNRLIAGGLREAGRHYQTDYWEHSYRQGLRWLDRTRQTRHADRPLRISAGAATLVHLLDAEQYTWVLDPRDAELYLSTTRYDRHREVPGEIVHAIEREGVPLLYIIRPDTTYRNNPFFAIEPEQIMDMAARFGRESDWKRAVDAYRDLPEDARRHAGILNNLSVCYLNLGQLDSAATNAQRAIDLDPDHEDARLNLALAWHGLGLADRAADSLHRLLEPLHGHPHRSPKPVHHRAAQLLSKIHRTTGNLSAAAQTMVRILKFDPRDPDSWIEYFNVGSRLHQRGHLDSALAIYKSVSEVLPNDPYVRKNKGALLYSRGQYNEAASDYRTALRIRPEDADARFWLGKSFQALGKLREAGENYRAVLALDPRHRAAVSALHDLESIPPARPRDGY